MNALRRWYVLRYWRRRFGKGVCKNCVHLHGVECKIWRQRIVDADRCGCSKVFTLYDAAKQRLHYDRYAK